MAGACSGGKFVVSWAGEAYDAHAQEVQIGNSGKDDAFAEANFAADFGEFIGPAVERGGFENSAVGDGQGAALAEFSKRVPVAGNARQPEGAFPLRRLLLDH